MLRKTLLFFYVIIVTGLSLLPASLFPISGEALFPHADKVVHFVMYAIFTFLLFYTWPDRFSCNKTQFIPILYIFIWGTVMEILQGIGDYGRNFSYLDIVANTLGFLPGWLAWKFIYCNRNKMPVTRK